MIYLKEHFEKCSFNPLVETSMIKTYPKLAQIVEMKWMQDNNLEKILKYVIMVFDPKSPLMSISSLQERKRVAFDICGISKIGEDDKKNISENSYNEILPELIIRYLINFPRSRDWAILCVLENKFWETVNILMLPLSESGDKKGLLGASESKSKIIENLKNDQKDIDYYFKTIFGEDGDIEKLARRIPISPQSIAKLDRSV